MTESRYIIKNKLLSTVIDLHSDTIDISSPVATVSTWTDNHGSNQLWTQLQGPAGVRYQSVLEPRLFLAVDTDHWRLIASSTPSDWQVVVDESSDRSPTTYFRLHHVASQTYLTGSDSGEQITLAGKWNSDIQLWAHYRPRPPA